jgi:hypothetical protein
MSAKRKKKGGDGDPPEAKRNKPEQHRTLRNRDELRLVIRPTFIQIRLGRRTKEHAGLVSPELICIPDIA